MDNVNREKILDRVRKCLALGNNEGATEAERERALTQAGKLLASINLSMSDVGHAVEERIRDFHEFLGAAMEWPRPALNGVAELFFCKYYRNKGEGRHYYVGKAINVATCKLMVEYVVANIAREAKKRASAAKLSEQINGVVPPGAGYTADWQYSFCVGAAEAVKRKCRELVKQREREGITADSDSKGGTALAVVGLSKAEMEANLLLLQALGIRLTVTGVRSGRNGDGFTAGDKHGSTINLHRQVGGASGPKLLGGK